MFRRALVSASASFKSTPTTLFATKRTFATGTFLDKELVTGRVLNVVKNFQKVDPAKVSATAHFTNDLVLTPSTPLRSSWLLRTSSPSRSPMLKPKRSSRSAMPSATFPSTPTPSKFCL
eukprot:TRINITY_DN182_c0_g1_i3.p1 TRINITY_DN182_c0_g1~~TRINITY_DN182_c0_g1_i3.p1  ORF type:complete len:119 (+),score=28.46 TRINITY_DN182_c0_g1_i3:76-432(+)